MTAQQQISERRVLLVVPPFATVRRPSLGVSLLKAQLLARGHRVQVRYLSLVYAERIGYALYDRLSMSDPYRFLGEWIAYPSLWGNPPTEVADAFWDASFPAGAAPQPWNDFGEFRSEIEGLQSLMTETIETFVDSIDHQNYDLIGLSTSFQQNLASLALAKRFKERSPATPVVLGGANCEAHMGRALLLNFDFIDAVFSGESDQSFPRYVDGLLNDDPAPEAPAGVFVRHPRTREPLFPERWTLPVTDLDALPYPDFDDFFGQASEALSTQQIMEIPFETSRGCWWGQKQHCTFCGLNGGGMQYRRKSPDRAAQELMDLWAKHGHVAPMFRAVDNILDMKYFHTFVPAMAKLPERARLFWETKSNLSQSQVQGLADGRVRMIQPGIESLSTEVLGLMRKGCNMLQNVQILKWSAQAGVRVVWNLLYGFPGESVQAYKDMERLLPLLFHLPPPETSGYFKMYRFSPYHEQPANWGLVNRRAHRVYKHLYRVDDTQADDIAYYFEFDDPKAHPSSVYAPLRRLAGQWRDDPQGASLVGFAIDDDLVVWDTRPIAHSEWTCLEGIYRELVVCCDSAHSVSAIVRQLTQRPEGAITEPEVIALLEILVERKLMIEEAGRYLSLIVLVTKTTPAIVHRQREQADRVTP